MDLGLRFAQVVQFYIGAKAYSEEAAKEKVAALQADLEKLQ